MIFEYPLVKPGYGFSTDGGNTWTTGVLTPLSGTLDFGFDPSCSFDRNGNAFYTYVASRGTLGPVYISRTTDNGQNWSSFQVSTATDLQDKPYMAVDNTGGIYDGRIYVSWTDFAPETTVSINFAFSTNQGSSFSNPVTLDTRNRTPGSGAYLAPFSNNTTVSSGLLQGSVPAVSTNGDVFVVWIESNGGTGSTGSIKMRKSTDGGGIIWRYDDCSKYHCCLEGSCRFLAWVEFSNNGC